MRVEWYGQSAFRLSDGEKRVFIDPFGDMSAAAARGMTWEYPPIEANADLLLVRRSAEIRRSCEPRPASTSRRWGR